MTNEVDDLKAEVERLRARDHLLTYVMLESYGVLRGRVGDDESAKAALLNLRDTAKGQS